MNNIAKMISETIFEDWKCNQSQAVTDEIAALEEECVSQAFVYFQKIMTDTPIKLTQGNILQKLSDLAYHAFWHTVELLDAQINGGRKFLGGSGEGIVTNRRVNVLEPPMNWPGNQQFEKMVCAILDSVCWELTDQIDE